MSPEGVSSPRPKEALGVLERLDLAAHHLSTSPLLQRASHHELLGLVTETIAEALSCSRCSLWRSNHAGSKFACLDSFDADKLSHTADLILPQSDHPTLFASLEARWLEVIKGGNTGPLCREFDAYMDLQDLGSLLILPIRTPDTPCSLLLLEQTRQTRLWTEEEKHAAGVLACLAARLLAEKHGRSTEATADAETGDQLNQIIDFLPDPTFIIDEEGTVTAWNEAMERMTGIPKDLIIGHSGHIHSVGFYGTPRPMLIDLALKPDPEVEKLYVNFSRVGDTLSGEGVLAGLRNGRQTTIRGSARPLYDKQGAICGAIETIHDISQLRLAQEQVSRANDELEHRVTERTRELEIANQRLLSEIAQRSRTQKELAYSEDKFRRIVDALPQIVFELDLEGRILLLNKEGLKRACVTQADVHAGISIMEFIHPEDVGHLRSNWSRIVAGERVEGDEYRFRGRNGMVFHATAYSQLVNNEGSSAFVAGFLVDETPKILAREALEKAHAELEHRVVERTSELAARNSSLKDLLRKQEINIGLASRILGLINAAPLRNQPLADDLNLFIAAHLLPRNREGGDHFFSRTQGRGAQRRTLVSLKDQSGHEVGCILRSIITDLFHNALLTRHPEWGLETTATRLNQQLCESRLFSDGEYLTAALLEIHHESLVLRYLLAGHPPLLLVREGKVRVLPETAAPGANLPLGMIDTAAFTAGELVLRPGDRLLLYTDGLLELPTISGKPALSAVQLAGIAESLVASAPDLPVTRLAQSLLGLLGGPANDLQAGAGDRPDDLSLVGLEIESEGLGATHCLRPADVHDLTRQRQQVLRHIANDLRKAGRSLDSGRLGMVLEEALYNAWKHGNKGSAESSIQVKHWLHNDLRLEIADEGAGFDPEAVPNPLAPENRAKSSGRGLYLIRRFADEAAWTRGGSRLHLSFAPGPLFLPPHQLSGLPVMPLWNESTSQQP